MREIIDPVSRWHEVATRNKQTSTVAIAQLITNIAKFKVEIGAYAQEWSNENYLASGALFSKSMVRLGYAGYQTYLSIRDP